MRVAEGQVHSLRENRIRRRRSRWTHSFTRKDAVRTIRDQGQMIGKGLKSMNLQSQTSFHGLKRRLGVLMRNNYSIGTTVSYGKVLHDAGGKQRWKTK